MCSASSSVTSPYTCPHPGHSQGKIFAHLAQGYVPTLFGRKEQYKVTVCILRLVPPQGTPEESHSVLLAYQGFPGGSAGKEFACNVGDLGREDFLEKGMATHFSILAWRILWTTEL